MFYYTVFLLYIHNLIVICIILNLFPQVKLIEEERRPVDTVTHLAALGSVRKVMDSTAQISDKKRWAPRKQQVRHNETWAAVEMNSRTHDMCPPYRTETLI